MKSLTILAALTLLTANAVQAADSDGSLIATLFVNSQVAKCVAQVQEISKTYEAITDKESIKVEATTESVTTTISYRLIEGGDIVAGTVDLVILESLGLGMWGEPRLFVSGCKVKKNIR